MIATRSIEAYNALSNAFDLIVDDHSKWNIPDANQQSPDAEQKSPDAKQASPKSSNEEDDPPQENEDWLDDKLDAVQDDPETDLAEECLQNYGSPDSKERTPMKQLAPGDLTR